MSAARIRIVARVGRKGGLPPFVLGSLVAHGLLIVAMVLLPSLRSRAKVPIDPLVVNLVAPMRSQPAVQSAPPAPTPAKPPEGTRVATKKPEPVPDKPRKKPPKVEEKRPDPAPRTPPGPVAANPAPGEAGPGGPSGPAGDSIVPLEGGDVEFAWYRAQVTAALYSQWRKPVLRGAREAIEVHVTFEILRDGGIRNLRVDAPSGVPSLDRSALRAVTDASPLPPLPPNWREPTLPAGFVFRLHPE